MSLVQRVTPIQGSDREPPRLPEEWYPPERQQNGYGSYGTLPSSPRLRALSPPYSQPHRLLPGKSTPRSVHHVISYDTLAAPLPSVIPSGRVSAYKISTGRRLAQVIVTVLACWLASGIVFGFAALKPVLINEGVYRELCTADELEANIKVCYKQDLRLNLFFAAASTTCNISALPVGTILDRFGPRVAAVLGSVCLAIGSILMAFAFGIPAFDGYLIGNVFLALGGTFIFVPSFSIAHAFPKLSGTIVATVTGAFDASAAVFLLLRIAYESSNGRFSPRIFFVWYLVVPVLIFLAQFTLFTPDGYKTVPQLEDKIGRAEDATRDAHDSDDELDDNKIRILRTERRDHRESKVRRLRKVLGDAEFRHERDVKEEQRLATSRVWGALHGKSALEQMMSPWFILITLLTVLQMLRMNFFIATIRSQYEYMLGSESAAKRINTFFDIALPVGGVAATPMIGILLDRVRTAHVLAILVAMISAVGVLGCLPYVWAGYVNVVLFVVLRPLYYSAMSDYAVKVFGFVTFGRVYGSIICFSGLVNLLQPLIDAANHDLFHDNPIPINLILASLGFVFGLALVMFVYIASSKVQKMQAAEDAAVERHRLIPEPIYEENEDVYDF